MRISLPLTFVALAASAHAQTTVYSNAAPRATATVIAGSDAGAPGLVYWGGWATDGTSMFNFGGRGVNSSGSALSTYFNSLDAYNPTSNTWTNLSAQGDATAPSNRFRPAMAYDPIGNRIVVFGGSEAPGDAQSDCYAFDLGTNTWSQIANPTPGTTGPSARFDAQMAYDPTTASLILFGGDGPASGAGDRLGDTWLLNGNTWVQLSPANSPSARALHAITTRTAPYNDIVLVGGRDAANTINDETWRWDGGNTNWVQITPVNSTAPVSWAGGSGIVYDSVREVVVMIGGTGTGAAPSNTTAAGGWSSEYDCVTNEWRAYGDSTTSQDADDPVWGNVQRMTVAFLNGKTYFWGGQNVPFAGDSTLASVKEYQASPLAAATAYGAGCSGQSGLGLSLAPDNAPWTGRTWNGTCSNLGAASFALTLWGFNTAALPLDAILPGFGQAGCTLLDTADAIDGPGLAVGGQLQIGLPLVNDPALAGATLYVQMAEIDFGFTSLWTSNGLTLEIGAL